MAAAAPLAIGTRGTVGSLVRKEIEYFTKLELDRNGSSRKPRSHVVDMGSCGRSNSRSGFWFLTMTWKRKKPKVSRGFLPRICSVSEVSETNRLNGISGFNYMILKDDVKYFDNSIIITWLQSSTSIELASSFALPIQLIVAAL
ncbi:hypothetical protein FEM48_Zijuj01G0128900 [Ziziphus jujuba var. spinosa]|uniref:Uncharacterized protein n=1 Tax=Ziziphus jujuba var. spinosa TaxID=714518 RepID=A0A978W1D4_ZIZJJ|nr:hypothetical protein FEM48_Zijuj01G0128900 [Ziziphus jujuba var. spinosa]